MIGWTAGREPDDSGDLSQYQGVLGAATFTYAGNFTFNVSMVLTGETPGRFAYEEIWARDTMAALVLSGCFYRDTTGVTFVDADLLLQGLGGASNGGGSQ